MSNKTTTIYVYQTNSLQYHKQNTQHTKAHKQDKLNSGGGSAQMSIFTLRNNVSIQEY